MKKILFATICLVATLGASAQKGYTLSSPDKKLKLEVQQSTSGELNYTFTANGQKLIGESQLGLSGPATFQGEQRRKVDTLWRPVWGKRAVVTDRYNELTLNFAEQAITLRAYNDGVAFRYTPRNTMSDATDRTQYNFAGDYTAWFYNGENHNIGPVKLSECDGVYLPVMTVKADDTNYLSLHEADLRTGEPLTLRSAKGSRAFAANSSARDLKADESSAWRVILYGTTPGVAVDSHLIELLNPDPVGDFSWVKPGVAVWDWRIDGAIVDNFTYSMSLPSWLRMVDFAAAEGLKHLVLDANWYGAEFEADSDPVAGDKASQVKQLLVYAKEKGVGIWLYLNDVAGRQYPIEQTLKQYGEWGAAGVKYGFMNGSPEQKNDWTRYITELCAKNHLLVDYHDGPVHPYGQMRTWPNAVTREFCHAQLDAHRVFTPKTFVTTVFVNMVAGPIDMNNGMFDLRQGNTTRVDENQPVPSTLASEAARTLITFSGATILPDIPEFYRKYPALLRFISAQQMPWIESRTLSGSIGEYIVMMRQNEEGFLIGAATNEQAREVEIPLDFLPKGEYQMLRVQDGEGAHYLTHRETIRVDESTVSRKDRITVQLAPGGGACMLITKTK